MINKSIFIRIVFWLGIVFDTISAIEMVASWLAGNDSPFVFQGFSIFGGFEYRYAMGIAAWFMIAWTVLLAWAIRKPVERRGVLLITAWPLIVGLLLTRIFGFVVGVVPLEGFIFTTLLQTSLIVLFTIAGVIKLPGNDV